MIIVAGCSWACGEWPRGDLSGPIEHEGLAQYIREAGVQAITMGIPGGGNLAVAHKIKRWIERHPDTVEKIFVMQTEYDRDFSMVFSEDYEHIEYGNDVANRMIERFYHRLMDINRETGIPIYLMGGLGDTLDPELIHTHYSGITVACQSISNLLLNGSDRIDVPVLSWYTKNALDLIQKVRSKLPDIEIENLTNLIDLGAERESNVFACADLFWPDGYHPNRKGHKLLFDFLVERGHLATGGSHG